MTAAAVALAHLLSATSLIEVGIPLNERCLQTLLPRTQSVVVGYIRQAALESARAHLFCLDLVFCYSFLLTALSAYLQKRFSCWPL